MSCPMVAVTGGGTTFGCAAISLTESGMAVLDEGGSRLGFVPYDSLRYVVPAAGMETGTAMTVRTTDDSAFSCASISQTGSGVAALNASGARVGFVPYDTLQYVLPEGKAGESLSGDCELPAGVGRGATESTDESEEDVTEEFGGDGSGPESGSEESERTESEREEAETAASETGASGSEGSASDSEEEGVWEDAREEAENEETAASAESESESGSESAAESESESQSASPSESESDGEDDAAGLWQEAEESTEPTDSEAPVSGEGEGSADAETAPDTEAEAEAETAASAETGDSQRAEREEAGESEMQVEWSFGEYEE